MTARRSPPSPGAIERARRARSPSAKPASPPRRPTMRQRDAWTTTWTPWRRSHVRSSKPSLGPRGRRISPVSSRSAPCGGERPTGSRSRTGSRIASSPNRRIWAGTRRSYRERRAGPVTATRARSAVPTWRSSGLRSSASSRALPHHQPASARATASDRHPPPRRRGRSSRIASTTAPTAIVSPTPSRTTFAAASPRHRLAASRCGRARRRLSRRRHVA